MGNRKKGQCGSVDRRATNLASISFGNRKFAFLTSADLAKLQLVITLVLIVLSPVLFVAGGALEGDLALVAPVAVTLCFLVGHYVRKLPPARGIL